MPAIKCNYHALNQAAGHKSLQLPTAYIAASCLDKNALYKYDHFSVAFHVHMIGSIVLQMVVKSRSCINLH